jgi:polysaccharide biosynthesis protein PslG
MCKKRVIPLLLVVSCVVGVFSSPAAADPRFWVGVNTHLGRGKGDVPASLAVMTKAGITTVRDELPWNNVERRKGSLAVPPEFDDYINQTVKAGIQPLLILDYGNKLYDNGAKPLSAEAMAAFTRYAVFVTHHFQGRIHFFEIWNEWDGNGLGGTKAGTADQYVALVKSVAPQMKAVDASITLLGGAVTHEGLQNGYSDQLLAAGLIPLVDGVSIHPYNYFGRGKDRTPSKWLDQMNAFENAAKAKNDGKEVPLYVTEMGWPTNTSREGTPIDQAGAYLAQTFLSARTLPFLRGIWWYDFTDDGLQPDNKEQNFGLLRPDLTPKTALYALSAVAKLVSDGEFLSADTAASSAPAAAQTLKFRMPDNHIELAIWKQEAAPVAPAALEVKAASASRAKVEITHIVPSSGVKRTDTRSSTLTLSEMPVLISGKEPTIKGAEK